jgi:chromosome segregation ATPase
MARPGRDSAQEFTIGLETVRAAWESREADMQSLRDAVRERTVRLKAAESKCVDLEAELVAARRRIQAVEGENAELKSSLQQLEQNRSKFESVRRTILSTLQGGEEDSKQPPSPQNSSSVSAYSALATATPKVRDRSKPTSPQRYVDGKKFFSTTRKRLSYECFSEFLSYIKRVNNKEISKEQAVEEVKPVFGPENEDLYEDFVVLLTRKALG